MFGADDKKTLEILTARSMSEELRLPEEKDVQDSKALNSGAKQLDDTKGKEAVCYNCCKQGHIKRNCF